MDVQQIIDEVAKRHRVLLSEQDPVLVVVTLNELVLAQVVEQLMAAVAQGQRSVALANAEHLEASRRELAKLVATSGAWLSEQVTAAGSALAEELNGLVRQAAAECTLAREQREVAQKAAAAACRERRRAWWASAAVAAVALILAGVAVLSRGWS